MLSLFDFLFIGALALISLYLYLSWNLNYWKKQGIDYDDKPSVLFGSMTDALLGKKQWGQIHTELYRKFPGKKVVGWFKMRTPALIIRDPELIRKVLVSDFDSFRNNDVFVDPEVDPIMGNNIFVLKDDLWKKIRALITPAFTAGKIKLIYPEMKDVAKELTEYLKQHQKEIPVKPTISRYTSEIVARCAFGIKGNNLKESKSEMAELGSQIFSPSLVKHFKFLSFFMVPKLVKIFKMKLVPGEVINFFDGVLRDVIVHRQQNDIERSDLIQYFIEVKRKSLEVAKGNIQSDTITKVYSDNDILAGCIMFFVEGYETSANIVTNILYQIAMHKDVQETLRKEIDETLSEGELTFEKLHAMKYLHKVFAETNRLLPASFSLQKICTERYKMDIGKEKPLIIEKDTPVTIPVYALHTDPLYWEDADEFKPDRFSEREEAIAKSKGIYLPFSDGPRVCPGSRIASTIIKLAVVQILSELEIVPTSKTPEKYDTDPHYFMIAHKGGIYLRFVERSR